MLNTTTSRARVFDVMAALITGGAFGAAMVAGGLHNPAVIISQTKLQSSTALTLFLTATASSTAIYHTAESLSSISLQPRSSSPLGLFGTYGANIIGGCLLGAGMALTGAGPETLVPQVAAGVPSGIYALGGALLGGILWTGPVKQAVGSWNTKVGVSKPETAPLQKKLGLPKWLVVFLLEAACVSAVYNMRPADSTSRIWNSAGVQGGLLIGAAQLVSLLTRRAMMGISGSYEEFGNNFWWLCRGGSRHPKPSSSQNMLFWLGTLAGSFGMLRMYSENALAAPTITLASYIAATGGCLMVIGSRLAGGCTSGHGISGMSLLSTASLVTIASAFASGAAAGLFLSQN